MCTTWIIWLLLFLSLYHGLCHCDASDHRVLKLDDIFKSKNPCRAKILGSFNGSLLIKADKNANYILWNPSINKLSAWNQIDNMKRMLSKNDSPSGSSEFTDVCVYNFHCNSWRYLRREFPYYTFAYRWIGDIHRSIGVTLRSSTLGSMVCQGFSLPYVIVYFDMDSERFREIPLPDWLPKDTKFELRILSGCRCITHRDTIGNCFEAWAMKEYGVKESWTKLFVTSESFRSLSFNDQEKLVIFNLKEKRIISFHDYRVKMGIWPFRPKQVAKCPYSETI